MSKALMAGVNPYLPLDQLASLFIGKFSFLSHPAPHPPFLAILSIPFSGLSSRSGYCCMVYYRDTVPGSHCDHADLPLERKSTLAPCQFPGIYIAGMVPGDGRLVVRTTYHLADHPTACGSISLAEGQKNPGGSADRIDGCNQDVHLATDPILCV